jgi:hypothetical protein
VAVEGDGEAAIAVAVCWLPFRLDGQAIKAPACGVSPAALAKNKRRRGHDQKDPNDDLGHAGGDAAITEHRSDQRNDEKDKGTVQQGGLLDQAAAAWPLGPAG